MGTAGRYFGIKPDMTILGGLDIRYAVRVNGELQHGHIWPDPTAAYMTCGLPTSFIVFPRSLSGTRLNWSLDTGWNIADDDPLMLAVAEFLMLYYA